ncbi:uncharacterized protein C8R40DRAFT_1127992 [Lentinula edodes]|uniref:uncharacterized protein n=1 Tax=Lentinula edodes TaxID=5353 RepID=UPI001E8DD6C9|nr:uncharacterized protein C8R40DRAFT_1127992 [Lentinula edodes]KAH7870107.1 hypothetical protein C8R40DRAFT_1127992 [Lentinula edodes]
MGVLLGWEVLEAVMHVMVHRNGVVKREFDYLTVPRVAGPQGDLIRLWGFRNPTCLIHS